MFGLFFIFAVLVAFLLLFFSILFDIGMLVLQKKLREKENKFSRFLKTELGEAVYFMSIILIELGFIVLLLCSLRIIL